MNRPRPKRAERLRRKAEQDRADQRTSLIMLLLAGLVVAIPMFIYFYLKLSGALNHDRGHHRHGGAARTNHTVPVPEF